MVWLTDMEERRSNKRDHIVCMTRQRTLASGLRHSMVRNSGNCTICEVPLLTDLESWIAAAEAVQPTVILVDTLSRVPHTAIRELRQRFPETHILLWVLDSDSASARQALDMGVRGLVKTDTSPEMLSRCFERVAAGEMWFDRRVTLDLMSSPTIQLSRREYQLMVLVCNGLSNKEIADTLVLAEGTIKFYLSRLFRKCSVSDRLELALFGLRHFQHSGSGSPIDLVAPAAERRVLVDQLPERRYLSAR